YAGVIHADKWIPVLPNTDVALHLAIAYVWITEGTYDKKYVETHTYGFDKFKAYVLGEEDGVPKTPKWAEQICGVPARTIKALARTWAKKKTSVAHMCGGPYMRGPYGTEPARTEIYLLAMQGIGKPGVHQLVASFSKNWVMGHPKVHPTTMAGFRWPMLRPIEPLVTKVLIPDAILNPPISWYGNTMCTTPVQDQFNKYEFPKPGYPEIRMIWTETPCWTACWNGGYKMVEALRSPKVEFVLAQHPWLEDDALFADVILPVTTTFENDIDIMADDNPPYSTIFIQYRCIDPIGESKSDVEICEMIAEKLGLLEQFTGGMTHEDVARIAFENSGVAEFISWEEFLEKQYFVVPTDPKWKEIKPGMQWYWEQPEGKGLNTKSGKIEFFAQWLYEHFGNDPERPPVAHYIPYGKTWQESRFHPKAQKYPLLVVSNHPRWRVHAEGDDITWIREIPTCKIRGPDGYLYEPVWIHPIDAAKRGIKHGDIVKVYNDRGAVLGAAYVTERITPGSVYMDHGARLDLISLDPLIDRGGEINLICPKETYPVAPLMVVTAFLVEVERVDLEELKKRYPEAFARRLHPDIGPYLDTWLVG
ncbi:MAG: molybdopterin-dependent oxidoreductase, partial [Nitrososphaerota archaeon]